MRWLEPPGLPSSEPATAPAPTISPNSESRSPLWPTEMAPIGYTRVSPARTDWRTMKPTAAWLSVTGSVFGMAHTVVNPPAAAARAPLAIVSTSSLPRSEEHTSELQSHHDLVCRLLLEKKNAHALSLADRLEAS